MKWTEEELIFLKNEFPNKGTKFVANLLNRTISSIEHKAQKIGLKITDERRKEKSTINGSKRIYLKEYKIPNLLENITKYNSYILGILWTDGYFSEKQKTIGITLIKEDIENIKWIFDKNGTWFSYNRKREGRKDSISLSGYNPDFIKSLIEYNFDKKSIHSPIELWNKLPELYKKYFFRGIIDGDGCFYVNKKNSTHQFSIYSTYEQNWNLYISILENLGCKCKITKTTTKNGKSSCLRITNKKDILILINWVYSGYEKDKIGLERKYKKTLEYENN